MSNAKPKTGRPPSIAPRKMINLTLTDDERDLLDRAAERVGLKRAQYIRVAALAAARAEIAQN